MKRGSFRALPRTAARVALTTVIGLALAVGPAAPSTEVLAHSASSATDPSVITEWNAVATETIVTDARRITPEPVIWQAFVSVAMYNAVVGIEGRYAPYRWKARGPRGASSVAAAAAAAHRVLSVYFPGSKARLETAYAASLAAVPDGSAKDRGVRFGVRAADHVIALREDDGRSVTVEFTRPAAPGIWRPTPPGYLPFKSAWMGRLRPLLLTSSRQFRPGPPPALTSGRYAEDLAEVKAYGGRNSTQRSRSQTETALFFASDVGIQEALRDYGARHGLGIAEMARLFAAVNTVAADAVITTWDSKLHYGSWRPLTAIRLAATDGNPSTEPDPHWQPLIDTPPHPDYLSGHATVGGAIMRALSELFGSSRVDLRLTSATTGATRYYEYADQYNRDVVDARVWAGIHTRTADRVGNDVGQRLAVWALQRNFRPKT
ncbi:vanadium-dependent haloperoxidase [Streptomyces sp. NPDC046261]|uniref:vanadium-dependent haloperoxidase n=1 Tax=Streptomyces sp. NPDC046261 TaxID=3157200 RepID=UPI0033EE8EB5